MPSGKKNTLSHMRLVGKSGKIERGDGMNHHLCAIHPFRTDCLRIAFARIAGARSRFVDELSSSVYPSLDPCEALLWDCTLRGNISRPL